MAVEHRAMRPNERFRRLMGDPGLRQRFLPPMTAEEVAAVEALLDPVVAECEAWCDESPLLNHATVIPLALLTIVPFPYLDAAAIATRVKAAVWIYALDDLMDSGKPAPEDMFKALREILAVASLDGIDGLNRTEIAGELARLKCEFQHYPLFRDIQPFWAATLSKLIDGMMFEYWASSDRNTRMAASVDLDQYLYFSRQSIANPHLMVAGMIVEKDHRVVAYLPQLFSLAERCAEPIRLANDLCTFRREQKEGAVNALTIKLADMRRMQEQRADEELIQEAMVWLGDRVERSRESARQMASVLWTPGRLEQRFIRAMDLAVDLYMLGDYRDWLSGVAEHLEPA